MPERRPRISVVNDNAEFLDLMAAILDEDAGYDVSLFKGEVVEISELAASDPDLIIVDLLLGGASGWEIVTLARSDERLASAALASAADPAMRQGAVALASELEKERGLDVAADAIERLGD